MAESDPRAGIAAFLAAHSTLTLATVGPGGRPMAASLFFATGPDLRLYWVSGPSSRHSQNVTRQPAVAVTVHNETWSWTAIAGVQLEGQALVVPAGPDWQAARNLYLAKFPFVAEFQAELSRSDFYVFSPSWMRWIDNALGFGHKEEIGLRN
jgi:uncharacterized protein YhbP (UPF0306 family)